MFKEIKELCPDSVLLLAGNGKLEGEIKEKCSQLSLDDSVRFLGLRNDIDKLFQCADVFLFPSLYEGLPVTMVEAQSSGIKCFISDVIPQQCVLTDDVTPLSLESGAKHWAEEISALSSGYDRKDRYSDMLEAGFDITANAEWLCDFYLTQYKKTYGDAT